MRALAAIVLAGCKATLGEGAADASLDGHGADALVLGPWTTPTPLAIMAVGDDDPSATGDLLELYFNRTGDIYVTTRAGVTQSWGTPTLVAELSSPSFDTTPEVSYDGMTIYLASNRPGTIGDFDIWTATRASRSAAWSTPTRVAELCTALGEGAANTVDGFTLVLDSSRDAPALDVFVASRGSTSAPWGVPAKIAALSTTSSDGNPMLSPDGLSIYFDSNRGGNNELYVATRASPSGTFGAPQLIAEIASATSAETDPWLSSDGHTLLFTSDRDGTLRLWQTTR